MKIVFHGKLRRLFGESYEMATTIPADAIEGLSRQLPNWPSDMPIDVIDFPTRESLVTYTDAEEIHLVPAMIGGGGVAKIIIGAALIAVALFVPGLGTFLGASVASMLFMAGASLILSGIMQLMYKAPSVNKSDDPPPSKYLGNNGNTTAIGTYRIMAWGRNWIAGHWLSLQVDAKSLVMGRFPTTPPA